MSDTIGLFLCEFKPRWKQHGDTWHCETARSKTKEYQSPEAASREIALMEEQSILGDIAKHGVALLKKHPDKARLASFKAIDPDIPESGVMHFPIRFDEGESLIHVECRYDFSISENWACLIPNLPIVGLGDRPLIAHLNCQAALARYLMDSQSELGTQGLISEQSDLILRPLSNIEDLSERSIYFPLLID